MAKSPEQQIEECKILLENYEKHLCISFPHSIALKQMEPKWKKEKEDIDGKCKEAVNDLNPLLAQSGSKKNRKIQALKDQARKMVDKYKTLSDRALGITDRLNDWEMFQQRMNSFEEWLHGSNEEMNDISQYYRHLQFFQDMKDRYEKVRKDTEERKKEYSTLQQDYQYHLTIKQQPFGIEPMTAASKKTSQEKNGEKEDSKREQGKAATEDEGKKGKEGENGAPDDSSKQQEADHDAEEYKEEFNQYQSKWNKVHQSWSSLKKKLDDFIAKKAPWEKIADLYNELNGHKESIEQHKTAIDDKGKKKTDNTSPSPVLEDYQQLAKEISSDDIKQKLSELKDLVKAHITPKLLTLHLPVREFVTLTEQLQDEWTQLSTSIDKSIRHATEKVNNWESKAGECMRHTLEQQENGYAANDQIGKPHNEGSGQREKLLKCILGLIVLITFVFMIFLVLLVLSSVCLDGHSWYLTFYHLQRRLSFIKLDEQFADYS